jgi:hypothetical protein
LPVALAGFRIVILGPVLPGIIGDFVIVPNTDEWMLAMRLLQNRVGLVERMAQAIVVTF